MSPLVKLVTIAVLPIAVLISFTHLIGADHGPGDGFTAGIISSLGFTLQYIAFGHREARRMFRRLRFQSILAAGLGVAIAAAVLPMFFGLPLLALQEISIGIPMLGEIRLTRAMMFDVGIFMVVLGGAMLAVDSLGEVIE